MTVLLILSPTSTPCLVANIVDDLKKRGQPEIGNCYSSVYLAQVADEIEERQQFLVEARASGVPFEGEDRVMAEISQRMSELKRFTPPSAS